MPRTEPGRSATIFGHLRNTLRADLRGDTERGAMVRSAGATAALKVGATAIAFGASLLYARALGPHGYGLYAYVTAWATLLAIPGLGIPGYLVREGAKMSANLSCYLLRMRITQRQADTIKRLVKQTFGGPADVYLFGSRVNDDARGGDIDLYVEPAAGDHRSRSGLQNKLRLASLLQRELGEQKFDIVIAQDPRRAIEVEARSKGIRL